MTSTFEFPFKLLTYENFALSYRSTESSSGSGSTSNSGSSSDDAKGSGQFSAHKATNPLDAQNKPPQKLGISLIPLVIVTLLVLLMA